MQSLPAQNRQAIRAAICDLDGTLADTLGDFVLALNRMLRELGFAGIDADTVRPLIGKGSEHLVAEVLKLKADTARGSHTLGPGYVQLAANTAYQKHYRAINGQATRIYPGVREGLQAMTARNWPLVCVTNKPTDAAKTLLTQLGLDVFFAQVWGGDAFARKKPDPLPLMSACAYLGLAPHQVLMVGDSANDAAAAEAAGMPVALMRYGYNHGQPIDEVPAWAYADRLDELITGWC